MSMTNIRNKVFETNSSSLHAICVSRNKRYKKQNFIQFEIGYFGWDCEKLCDIHSKASYLITAIYSRDKNFADEKIEKLKEILDRSNIEYELPAITKSEKIVYERYVIDGGIDHGGDTEDFVNAVLSDDEPLMRYMFGKSYIIISNDNDGCKYWDKSKKRINGKKFDVYIKGN